MGGSRRGRRGRGSAAGWVALPEEAPLVVLVDRCRAQCRIEDRHLVQVALVVVVRPEIQPAERQRCRRRAEIRAVGVRRLRDFAAIQIQPGCAGRPIVHHHHLMPLPVGDGRPAQADPVAVAGCRWHQCSVSACRARNSVL